MATEEPIAEQPAAAAEAVAEEASPAPEAPRKWLKPPKRPDDEAFKAEVDALQKKSAWGAAMTQAGADQGAGRDPGDRSVTAAAAR